MNVSNRVYEITKLISDAKEKNEEMKRKTLIVAINSRYGKFTKSMEEGE
jgi:hypothetical protein